MAHDKKSMDTLNVPDKKTMSQLSDGHYNSKKYTRRSYMDSLDLPDPSTFQTNNLRGTAEPERNKKEVDDDFLSVPKQKVTPGRKGVKVGRVYVVKTKLVRTIILCILAVVLIVFTFPPIATNNADLSLSENRNIFEQKGLTELKEEILKGNSVFDIEALSSERSENYRVCKIMVEVTNPTPFEVKIPAYSVVSVADEYINKVVSAKSSKAKGDVINPFDKDFVFIEVLINVSGLSDAEYDELVTSLILKSTGMTKKITKTIECPCIPVIVFVSNNGQYNLED